MERIMKTGYIAWILLIILFSITKCTCAQNTQAGRPVARNDSFYNHTAASVLTNDKDPNGDKLYVNWFYINGTQYIMKTGSDLWNIPGVGTISFKRTGEIKCDTSLYIEKYQIADLKGGVATAWCRYSPKPVSKPPAVERSPKAVNDVYVIDHTFRNPQGQIDTADVFYSRVNVLSNDSIKAIDSFKIIGWMGYDGYLLPCGDFKEGKCHIESGTGINFGCYGIYSTGNIFWCNCWRKPVTQRAIVDFYYIAQDKKGRIICANVTLIVNP